MNIERKWCARPSHERYQSCFGSSSSDAQSQVCPAVAAVATVAKNNAISECRCQCSVSSLGSMVRQQDNGMSRNVLQKPEKLDEKLFNNFFILQNIKHTDMLMYS